MQHLVPVNRFVGGSGFCVATSKSVVPLLVSHVHIRSGGCRSAVELARIVADTMDSMFGFSLRVPPATAQCLTDGVDAVVQKCVLPMFLAITPAVNSAAHMPV